MIFIDGPQYRCFWKTATGERWRMDWVDYCGPIFSRDSFQDGGVDINEVPILIRKYAELWAKKVLKQDIILTPQDEEEYIDKEWVIKNDPKFAHTWDWDEHPEDYEDWCWCETCRSYMD